jgi:ferredoxin/flavodoxin
VILCFSASGNSRLVAELLARETGDELLSLNELFKQGEPWRLHSDRPYVVVSPIYAWRLPKKVEDFLARGEFSGCRQMYVITTMGGDDGAAGKYCRKIVESRGMTLLGYQGIAMPDNYMVSFKVPDRATAIEEIRKSLPLIQQTGERIKRGDKLPQKKGKPQDGFLSSVVNWGFRNYMANSKSFHVSQACIQCGKCVTGCPSNNITLREGKILFGKDCMFCLACLNNCPVHAIDYKDAGKKHGYYTCPPIQEVLPEKKEK